MRHVDGFVAPVPKKNLEACPRTGGFDVLVNA
jgi:hypothetical protein